MGNDTPGGKPQPQGRERAAAGMPELPAVTSATSTPARRLLLAASVLVLGFVIALAGVLSSCAIGSSSSSVSARATATAIAGNIAQSMTATASVNDFAQLSQRPLHLPALAPGAPCPISPSHQIIPGYGDAQGGTPVFIAGDGTVEYAPAANFGSTQWGGQKVLFWIAPQYVGPVLVRGHQLGGPHLLQFDGGIDQLTYNGIYPPVLPALKLLGGRQWGTPWPNWPSDVRVQAPGCYAMQIDGLSFSEIIVFQARESSLP